MGDWKWGLMGLHQIKVRKEVGRVDTGRLMAAKSHLDFPFSNPRVNARDKTKKRLVNANRGEGGDSTWE